MGIAIYSLIVLPQKHFSALAGGVALGIMMIPTITRTTEEMLLMVPHAVREAALGLGVPNWRTVLSITLRTASPGVITGCMLAFARVAGETAPLLFTAFGNQFWSFNLNRAHRRTAAADLCLRPLALRRVAPPGLGRISGADSADYRLGLSRAVSRPARGVLKGAS